MPASLRKSIRIGIPVRTTSNTEFENGPLAQLALNVPVEVEGRADATPVGQTRR